jgi:hypothetical protein
MEETMAEDGELNLTRTISQTVSFANTTAGATGAASGSGLLGSQSPNVLGAPMLSIYDAILRIGIYIRTAENQSQAILAQLNAHPHADHHALALQAIQDRNALLVKLRGLSTHFAEAISRALKEEGKLFDELAERYLIKYLRTAPANEIGDFQRKTTAAFRMQQFHIAQGHPHVQARTKSQLFRIIVKNSEPISREIIRASGRTNRCINTVSYFSLGGSLLLCVAGGVLTVLCLDEDRDMPEGVCQSLAFPHTLPQAINFAIPMISSLTSGYIVKKVADCSIIQNRSTGRRIGMIVTFNIAGILLIGVLLRLFVSALWDDF